MRRWTGKVQCSHVGQEAVDSEETCTEQGHQANP